MTFFSTDAPGCGPTDDPRPAKQDYRDQERKIDKHNLCYYEWKVGELEREIGALKKSHPVKPGYRPHRRPTR